MVQITKNKIAQYLKKYRSDELNTPRKFENAVNREYKRAVDISSRPLVKEIDVRMNWTKNRTQGWCPKATAYVTYANGSHDRFDFATVTGYGYSKSDALLTKILNEVALQNLYHKRLNPNAGLHEGYYYKSIYPHYDINRDDSDFAFFSIKHIASGDTFDGYLIKFR